ncbi:MAG: glycosyltransferase family 4 protein, partial [Clostridiales bacterium]|nr:glycosyltransferase family 4 protein [Clostridiales bacterium]
MNVLFLSIGRLSNIADNGIYTDLLREFRDNGHNVFVISPREKKLALPTEHSVEEGVNFLRVKIGNITKVNLVEKGISTIMIESLFLKELKKYY